MPLKLPKKFAPFAPWFAKHRRDAWTPVVKAGDGPPTASKFTGTPYLAAGEDWPACGNCGGPMRLFVQLDLDALPDDAADYGSGLLQAFFCLKDDCVHGDSEGDPFSECQLMRIIKPKGPAAAVTVPAFKDGVRAAKLPPRRIVGWTKVDDYPALAEMEELGLMEDDDLIRCKSPKVEVPGTIDDYCKLGHNVDNEKLAGWPGWVNVSTDYPDCPKCKKPMTTTIFQFGHSGHVPVMFGDGGQGNVFQCPRHKNVLAYAWTCG